MEIKCGDNLYKFYEKTFLITDMYEKIEISINYNTMPLKYLKDVSELCFVVRPTFVDKGIGQIELKNLKFEDNEITN